MLAGARRAARRAGPRHAAAEAADGHLAHLPALPRRHRLGDHGRGRRGRRRWAATGTAASSPTGTPATSPGPPRAAWSSSTTPSTDDRRTSGTRRVPRRPRGGRVDRRRSTGRHRALRLAHALVLGWGGIPVIWSGDELGQPNDPDWAAEPGHEDDNRWAHRPRLDWARAEQRHDRGTVAGRVFGDLVALVRRPRPAARTCTGRSRPGSGRSTTRACSSRCASTPWGGSSACTTSPRSTGPGPAGGSHELGVADARDEITGEAAAVGRRRQRLAAALRRALAHRLTAADRLSARPARGSRLAWSVRPGHGDPRGRWRCGSAIPADHRHSCVRTRARMPGGAASGSWLTTSRGGRRRSGR